MEQVNSTVYAGIIIGIVGALIALCGFLARYIWSRHVKENDDCAENNRLDHAKYNNHIEKK